MTDLTDDELLAALGVEVEPDPVRKLTQREERLLAGFEDIQRFHEKHGRAPCHSAKSDIFERLYAVRLQRLRALPDAKKLLTPFDQSGLLNSVDEYKSLQELEDDDLLANLGMETPDEQGAITVLRHVRPSAVRRADEVANRTSCEDFERFRPLFEALQGELQSGARTTFRFGENTRIEQGNFFILSGQVAYVAEVGEITRSPTGKRDARLRVVYSNGTESNLLMRSLQRALYKDETGRRVSDLETGALFGDTLEPGDQESGTIYVLRSRSTLPYIAKHRDLIHKIGVTGGKVEARVANAQFDPTYLLAEVEVVATYRLSGIHRVRLEKLLHRIFSPAQLDLMIEDRFGRPVRPREWFLVPLSVIDEAVQKIRDGSIADCVYDPVTAKLLMTQQ